MISKSLGHSRKFAELRIQAGKLGEFAQVLFPLLVANADALGRLPGDTFHIKHAILTTSPRREQDFGTALGAMDEVGLIRWYEGENDKGETVQVIEIVNFGDHQDLHKERPKSNLPEFSGTFRKVPPQSNLIQSNSIQSIRSPKEPGTAEGEEAENEEPGTVRGADVRDFIAFFCDEFSRRRNGARYMVLRHKDIPLVKRLLATYPMERLKKLATILLTTDEEWVAGTDRGIGILSTKASWLDSLLADFEAKRRVS
jgi:hypothetical protein